MNKQQLATKIWKQANAMRSKIEANEYKDYILGFMFYKYLCEAEWRYMDKVLGCKIEYDEYGDEVSNDFKSMLVESDGFTLKELRDNIGYFISYEYLFQTWVRNADESTTIAVVRDGLNAFERLINRNTHYDVFHDVFKTLIDGLSKLGTNTTEQTTAVRSIIKLINDIPMNANTDNAYPQFSSNYCIYH